MNCSNCYRYIPDGSEFCIFCGGKIDTIANINSRDLIEAASNGDVNKVSVLIEKGADVNAKDIVDRSALMFAACEGHVNIAKILIEKGADVNASVVYHSN